MVQTNRVPVRREQVISADGTRPGVTVAELPGQAHDAHIFAAPAQIVRFALTPAR